MWASSFETESCRTEWRSGGRPSVGVKQHKGEGVVAGATAHSDPAAKACAPAHV